jgi:hypothetical protein
LPAVHLKQGKIADASSWFSIYNTPATNRTPFASGLILDSRVIRVARRGCRVDMLTAPTTTPHGAGERNGTEDRGIG